MYQHSLWSRLWSEKPYTTRMLVVLKRSELRYWRLFSLCLVNLTSRYSFTSVNSFIIKYAPLGEETHVKLDFVVGESSHQLQFHETVCNFFSFKICRQTETPYVPEGFKVSATLIAREFHRRRTWPCFNLSSISHCDFKISTIFSFFIRPPSHVPNWWRSLNYVIAPLWPGFVWFK